MRQKLTSFLAFASTVAAPAVAFACPVCATREGAGPMQTIAIGALIVAPWFAAAGVGWWIRRGLLEEAALNSLEQRGPNPALDVDRS
jgi:hypothetical protein